MNEARCNVCSFRMGTHTAEGVRITRGNVIAPYPAPLICPRCRQKTVFLPRAGASAKVECS